MKLTNSAIDPEKEKELEQLKIDHEKRKKNQEIKLSIDKKYQKYKFFELKKLSKIEKRTLAEFHEDPCNPDIKK